VRAAGPAIPGLTVTPLAAHANPVYVEVAGTVPDAKADAEYFLAWIDRLAADAERRNRLPTGRPQAET
jgi:hypothetical protein